MKMNYAMVMTATQCQTLWEFLSQMGGLLKKCPVVTEVNGGRGFPN